MQLEVEEALYVLSSRLPIKLSQALAAAVEAHRKKVSLPLAWSWMRPPWQRP